MVHDLPVLPTKRPGSCASLSRIESRFHLDGLVSSETSNRYEEFRVSDADLKLIKSKKVKAFYVNQNAILDMFREVDAILDEPMEVQASPLPEDMARRSSLTDPTEGTPLITKINVKSQQMLAEEADKLVNLAVNVNFAINILLLAGKILAVYVSNSLSLLASAVDSAMDFLSTLIIFITLRLMKRRNSYLYPTGKSRFEATSIVIFSVFMISSFIQVGIESAQRLLNPNEVEVTLPWSSIIVMLATIAIKAVVWVWCRTIKNTSVDALTQDAENDIAFNTVSLIFPWIGKALGWHWLDATGAALLSIYIIWEWVETLFENVYKLTGRRASPAEHQRVVYLVTRFPSVLAVQFVNVFHYGDGLVAETDVVLPATLSLPKSHNIGESVQVALESLDRIERAYSHVDYSSANPSGHAQR